MRNPRTPLTSAPASWIFDDGRPEQLTPLALRRCAYLRMSLTSNVKRHPKGKTFSILRQVFQLSDITFNLFRWPSLSSTGTFLFPCFISTDFVESVGLPVTTVGPPTSFLKGTILRALVRLVSSSSSSGRAAFRFPLAISRLRRTSEASAGGVVGRASVKSTQINADLMNVWGLTLTIAIPGLCYPQLVHVYPGIVLGYPVQLQLLRVSVGFYDFSMKTDCEASQHRNCPQLVKLSNVRGYSALQTYLSNQLKFDEIQHTPKA